MYQSFFGLYELPFSLTPDTSYFYRNLSHERALNALAVGIQQGDGFVKISGEVGTGKTLLCRQLIGMLGSHYQVAHINNSFLSPDELKATLAQEIAAKVHRDMPVHQVLLHIQSRLVQLARTGKKLILLIDEAQAMPRDTLESLRLLSNLETQKRKLIQIILIGQPELEQTLARPDLRQLKQRIIYSEQLQAMSAKETRLYIKSRLAKAGCHKSLFSSCAYRLIHWQACGNPRLINVLAHKAMMSAWGQQQQRVGIQHVARAIADSSDALAALKNTRNRLVPAWSLGTIAAVGLLGWML